MAEQIQDAEQPQPGGLPPQRGQVGQVNDQQPQPPELLVRMDTNQLKRWRDQLLMHIPSDPTWGAAVASVLREILSSQIAHPDRRERDKARDALTAPVRPVGGDTQGMQPSPPARSAPTPGW